MKNRDEDNVVFTIIQHFAKVFSKFLHKGNVSKIQIYSVFSSFI